jgi:hypothetical protein
LKEILSYISFIFTNKIKGKNVAVEGKNIAVFKKKYTSFRFENIGIQHILNSK